MSPPSPIQSRILAASWSLLKWVLFVGMFVLLGELARLLAFEIYQNGLIIFWPPAGLVVAVFTRTPFRSWWKPILATLIGNLVFDRILHGSSISATLIFGIGNCVGGVVGGAFLKSRRLCSFSMESVADVWCLLVGGVLIAPAVNALTTGLLLQAGAAAFDWTIVLKTALGSGLGVLLVAPVILAWSAPGESAWVQAGRVGWRRAPEGLLLGAVTICTAVLIFDRAGDLVSQTASYPFWLFLPIIWAGLRFRPRFAYALVWGAMFVGMGNTAIGNGPFAGPQQSIEHRILLIQGFVFVLALTTIALSASVSERRKAEVEISRSRAVLQNFFDSASDLIAWVRPDGNVISANSAWRDALGFSESNVSSVNLRQIIDPESWHHYIGACKALEAGADSTVAELVLNGRNGRRVVVESSLTVYREDGRIDHFREVSRDITQRQEHERERERLIAQLQQAVNEVKTLRGFIPICSGCKRIRTEAGAWQSLEDYLRPRMEGNFTHGLCTECARQHFGSFWDEVEAEREREQAEKAAAEDSAPKAPGTTPPPR